MSVLDDINGTAPQEGTSSPVAQTSGVPAGDTTTAGSTPLPAPTTNPPVATVSGSPISLPVLLTHRRQSGVEHFQFCQRYALLNDMLRLEPIAFAKSGVALDVGRIYHARRYEQLGGGSNAVGRELTDLIDYIKSNCPLPQQASEIKTVERSAQLAVAMAQIVDTYCPFGAEWEVVAAEKEMEWRRSKRDIPFGGRLDLLLRNKKTGEYWVNDDKTTSDPPQIRAKTCSMEVQTILYPYLADQWLKEQGIKAKVSGVVHTIVQKSRLRYTGKDPSFQAYVDRVADQYKESMQVGHIPMILRSTTFRQKKEPADVRALLSDYQKFIRRFGGVGGLVGTHEIVNAQRSAKSCVKWGRPCKYIKLCALDPAAYGIHIAHEFVQVNNKLIGGGDGTAAAEE